MLHIKNVPCDPYYHLCEQEMESLHHLFIDCEVAATCWNLSELDVVDGSNHAFLECVNINLRNLDEEKSCLFVIICWNLWNTKNTTLWNNIKMTAPCIVKGAKNYLHDWREANQWAAPENPVCVNTPLG